MKRNKKIGDVIVGCNTKTVYIIRSYGGALSTTQQVTLEQIIVRWNKNDSTSEPDVIKPISSYRVFDYYPEDTALSGETWTSCFSNKKRAIAHIERLEEEHTKTKVFIENSYRSGLLTEEEYKERISQASA